MLPLTDLSSAFPEPNSTVVESITAYVYVAANRTKGSFLELMDKNEDGVFSTEITALVGDVHAIELESYDSVHVRDIEAVLVLITVLADETVTTTITATTATSTTQNGIVTVMVGGIALSGVPVLVIVKVASRRR